MFNLRREVKNSCKSCRFFRRGVRVVYNHCQSPFSKMYHDLNRRTNGLGCWAREKCFCWQKKETKKRKPKKINA